MGTVSALRILHVIPSISPLNGGPSFALHALVRALASLGVTVDVATTDDHGAEHLAVREGAPVKWDGVTYHFFKRKSRTYTFAPGIVPWLVRNVSKYDLVHVHSLFSFTSVAAAWAAIASRTPYLIHPHGSLGVWGITQRRPAVKRLSMRLVEMPILRHAKTLYLNTDQERAEMHQLGIHVPSEIIRYAIDIPPVQRAAATSLFHDYHPDLAGKKLVLFLSRLHPKKGLDLLLPAFRNVRTTVPNAVLLIVGEGDPEYVDQLRRLCDELGIADAVRFLGFLSGDLKWAALSAADVFVLPSYSENFGIAPIEAMATGTPVVVTDQAAVYKEIEQCSGGIVVPCDVAAMAAAIERLLRDPAENQRLGAQAKAGAERFSAIEVAKQTHALYQRLVPADRNTSATVMQEPESLSRI